MPPRCGCGNRDVEKAPTMPNITELVSHRSQTTSAPLNFCFSLYSPMVPPNNKSNEIGIWKRCQLKEKHHRATVGNFFSVLPLKL